MKDGFYTIGIMVDWIGSSYHYGSIEAIEKEAEGHNINLLYFAGTGLANPDEFHKNYPRIYEMITENYLDFLIVFSGVFDYATPTIITDFFSKIPHTPVITINYKLPQFPAVLLDNKIALKKLIRHMLEQHHIKKPGFLKGFPNVYDSNVRYGTYLETMEEYHLPVNYNLTVENCSGNFESGFNALRILLDERALKPGVDFDCIFALNDCVASGAMQFLMLRGYTVPDDVAICGFDDNEYARSSIPPISTVWQSYKKLASRAVRYFIDKETHQDNIYIPTQMIIRESCGCQNLDLNTISSTCHPSSITYEDFLNDTARIHQIISTVFAPVNANDILDTLIADFSRALLEFAYDNDSKKFSEFFLHIYDISIQTGQDITLWYKALARLKIWINQNVLLCKGIQEIQSGLDLGFLFITSLASQMDMKTIRTNENTMQRIFSFETGLSNYMELEEMMETIRRELTVMGFTHFYLFSYNNPQHPATDYTLHIEVTNLRKIETSNRYYKDFREIVERLFHNISPFCYIILPLPKANEIFGFIMLKRIQDVNTRILYENIIVMINTAFRNNKLVKRIKDANTELVATQVELKQELDAARRIQRSILPSTLSYPGFEIAAIMETAISVGGDYYDFIVLDDKCWLLIGDVSGHGVHSGLVAMMVQTAIHLILKREPDIALPLLLSQINAVVEENIRKLGELKYMTLLILAYEQNGKFTYSGMHLPLLVYRARTGQVEEFETNGVWLGITPDLTGLNNEDSFTMESGDILLLYTDGIIEAVSKTQKIRISNNRRLMQKLQENGSRSAQEIIDCLMQDLDDYILNDDVTLMVIKRL